MTRILLALLILPLFFVPAASALTRDEAVSAVTSRYRITKPAFLGGFNEIGTVLTPRREGLRANRPSKAFVPNVVQDRRLVVLGGGDLPLGGAHTGVLKPGERLHLYGVGAGDDYVDLDLHTVATYVLPGVRGATPLQASVRFRYDGGLQKVSARQLIDDIGDWLAAEEAARPAPTEPAPPARATGTVRLGQTIQEVTAVLGPPEKQILLGPKTVFVYPYLKVIFVDGKLTDAE